MTTRVPDCQWDSQGEESKQATPSTRSSRMRRGDISANVTREMRCMLDQAGKKGVANESQFQALAESCGFRVISDDDTSDGDRELESECPSSEEDDGNISVCTTCTSCCHSDHEVRGSRCKSYQSSALPVISASEISHCERKTDRTRGKTRPATQEVQAVALANPSKMKMWKVQSGVSKWDRIEPVVDNLGSPRDSSANHVLVEDSLPAKCKKLAIESSGHSAFRPVIARSQAEYSDSAKSSGTKYKIFMENPSLSETKNNSHGLGKSPRQQPSSSGSDISGLKRIVITRNEHGEKRERLGSKRHKVNSSVIRGDKDSDKEVEDTLRISKNPKFLGDDQSFHEMELCDDGKKAGGMIHWLREMNEGNRKLGPSTVRGNTGNRNHAVGRRGSVESSLGRESDDPTRLCKKGASSGPRQQRSDGQVVQGGQCNVTINSKMENMAAPGGRMSDSVELFRSEDKRHVDYRRNVNSNYEETDNSDEICASAFIGQYLYELWKNQCLCDVRIRVGKSSYLAHKIVLAAFSEVFCPNEPQKMPSLCFDIPNSTPDAVYQILLYLYTSEMELTDGILEEVLNAACFMGIWEVICLIKEILSKPTFENFGLYLEIRERQGMSAGLLDFPDIVREHLLELVDTPHFLNLSIEELETLLRDPEIMVESELDIVNVISKWIEYDPFHRTRCAGRLLTLVSFDCLPAETLFDIMEEKKHMFDMDALQVLLEAIKSHALKSKEGCRPVSERDASRERRSLGRNESASTCEVPIPDTDIVRPIDNNIKSFKEIRDQFASQRQTEARRMMPRGNIAKQYVNSHAVPFDDKALPPMKAPGNPTISKSPSRNTSTRILDSPCQTKQCSTANDTVKPVREFHLSSGGPKMNVEFPLNQGSVDLDRRVSIDRRNGNVNGSKALPNRECDDASYKPPKPQPCYNNQKRPPDEGCFRPGKSPSQGGWNNCYPPCKSPMSVWDGAEEEVECPDQPGGKRIVRRRGDIIKSHSSPAETTGLDKCSRKRVTFS